MDLKRSATRVAWGGLALLAVAALADSLQLSRLEQWNRAITSDAPKAVDGAPPELRFAEAHAMAASGASEPALDRYRALQADTPLGRAARVNAANLLIRQAMVIRGGTQPGQAIALIELAKASYREVLRHEPDHWAARYNLERAQRLLPDPEEIDNGPAEAKRNAERAATTMRGYSPGLP